MKKVLLFIFMSTILTGFAQDSKKLPAIDIFTILGDTINTATFSNGDTPVILCFWSIWCKYCIKELDALSELNKSWCTETGVKIIGIAVVDSNSSKEKIIAMMKRKNWDLELYLDENKKLAHFFMGEKIFLPRIYLFDKNQTIAYSHFGFKNKTINELYKTLIEVTKL